MSDEPTIGANKLFPAFHTEVEDTALTSRVSPRRNISAVLPPWVCFTGASLDVRATE